MTSLPDRAELELLDRETLIQRAEAAGVSRANILTRPELVDELLVRGADRDDPRVSLARGFFGKARDLLARVIEKGLHLPEAADRLRRVTLPKPPRAPVQGAVPTVTLAEIYAAQGHTARAIETLNRVLEREPDHAAARALLKQLLEQSAGDGPSSVREGESSGRQAASKPAAGLSIAPSEPPSGAPAEPVGFLDDDPLPWRYDVDECVAISVDPKTIFVYWEIREQTLKHIRRGRPDGSLALRVLVVTPSWEGPRSSTWDIDVGESIADWFVRDLPAGAIVRVAVGWRQGSVFLPVAHSSSIETPTDAPSPMVTEAFLAWTPEGLVRIPASNVAEAVIAVRSGRLGDGGQGTNRPFYRPRDGGRGGGTFGGAPNVPQGSSEHAYP
jgi:hypothetical protein